MCGGAYVRALRTIFARSNLARGTATWIGAGMAGFRDGPTAPAGKVAPGRRRAPISACWSFGGVATTNWVTSVHGSRTWPNRAAGCVELERGASLFEPGDEEGDRRDDDHTALHVERPAEQDGECHDAQDQAPQARLVLGGERVGDPVAFPSPTAAGGLCAGGAIDVRHGVLSLLMSCRPGIAVRNLAHERVCWLTLPSMPDRSVTHGAARPPSGQPAPRQPGKLLRDALKCR